MKRKISFYIRDILQNIEIAEDFIHGMSREEFENDRKTLYAVLRAIEVIGEATKHVPAEIRDRHLEIPWKEMAGMRDKVIHDYIDVDVESVWLVVKDRIVGIKPLIQKVLRELEKQEN